MYGLLYNTYGTYLALDVVPYTVHGMNLICVFSVHLITHRTPCGMTIQARVTVISTIRKVVVCRSECCTDVYCFFRGDPRQLQASM